MMFARLAVYAAIISTLWFNGSYAWSKGGTDLDRYAMVALGLTIDLCKSGLLPAASLLWQGRSRLPALALFLLWPFFFLASTFAGYAYLTTNAATATAGTIGNADERRRAQVAHDDASAALKIALTSPLWQTTSACTVLKTKQQTQYCEAVAQSKADRATAAATLSRITPADPHAEFTALATILQWPAETVTFAFKLAQAILIELAASVGLYAVHSRRAETPSERSTARSWWWPQSEHQPVATTQPVPSSVAVAPTPKRQDGLTAAPVIKWPVSHRLE